MIKRYRYYILLVSILCITLLACGEEKQLHQLKNYVAQLKQKVTYTQKKPKPVEFKLPEPVKYRSKEAIGAGGLPSKGNSLQAYPIKSFQFLGTVTQNQHTWAYLMAPDSMIYQVKEGDIIGDIYGKIIKIDAKHIEVLRSNAPGNAASERQVITLQLKE